MGNYTFAELDRLPTLATGQAEDLKIDEGMRRVWLSRVDPGLVIEETRDPNANEGRGEWTPREYHVPVTSHTDDEDEDTRELVDQVRDAVEFLNDKHADAGSSWYVTENTLSSTARADGKLRRIEVWHLTDDAARATGLID